MYERVYLLWSWAHHSTDNLAAAFGLFNQRVVPVEVVPIIVGRWLRCGRLRAVRPGNLKSPGGVRWGDIACANRWRRRLVVADLIRVDGASNQFVPALVAFFKDGLDERGVLIVITNNFNQFVSSGDLVILERKCGVSSTLGPWISEPLTVNQSRYALSKPGRNLSTSSYAGCVRLRR